MDKKPERTKVLLNEIDRLAYGVAIVLIIVLVITFFFIQSWRSTEELTAIRELLLALIPNLVSVLLLFAFHMHSCDEFSRSSPSRKVMSSQAR